MQFARDGALGFTHLFDFGLWLFCFGQLQSIFAISCAVISNLQTVTVYGSKYNQVLKGRVYVVQVERGGWMWCWLK